MEGRVMEQSQEHMQRGWDAPLTTARLVLAQGLVLEGYGLGPPGEVVGEICFNTAMTGYEEILTDPSYTGQLITFTFPHIGNVGVNVEDSENIEEDRRLGAKGIILHHALTEPSNWRATQSFNDWLLSRGIIGIFGVDTRALTAYIRTRGMPHGIISHAPDGQFDLTDLHAKAQAFCGIDGTDLVPQVSAHKKINWPSYVDQPLAGAEIYHVVALDYGVKRNILNLLRATGCRVTLVPASLSFEEVMALEPDGVFLSNGPGDPAETGKYAVPLIQKVIEARVPLFGICLGHQLLGLALGGKTLKMHQGHHGANHPVKDITTGKVEIVSMNHGFAVDPESLPQDVHQTHISLFDGTNCGIAHSHAPVFSVQHHPEASPGPQDSHYLFRRFVDLMRAEKRAKRG